MKVVIEVDLGNEAMQSPLNVIHAVENALHKQTDLHEPMQAGQGGPLRDVNGNTVGKWVVE